MSDEMTNEEKEFIKKVNVDKAIKKTTIAMVFIGISILTYVIPMIMGEYDFGIIFEVLSLIFLLVSRDYMKKYDEISAKKYNIFAIASIGWILIYDLLIFISLIEDFLDIIPFYYVFSNLEYFSIIYIILLFAINRDLSKADNPIRYRESTDWFYESYEGDKEENKNI